MVNFFDIEELDEFGVDMDMLAKSVADAIGGDVSSGRSDENVGVYFTRKLVFGSYKFDVEGYLYIREDDFNQDFEYNPYMDLSFYWTNWSDLGFIPEMIDEAYSELEGGGAFYGAYFINSLSDTLDRDGDPALDLYGPTFPSVTFYDNKDENDGLFYEKAARIINRQLDNILNDFRDEMLPFFEEHRTGEDQI